MYIHLRLLNHIVPPAMILLSNIERLLLDPSLLQRILLRMETNGQTEGLLPRYYKVNRLTKTGHMEPSKVVLSKQPHD